MFAINSNVMRYGVIANIIQTADIGELIWLPVVLIFNFSIMASCPVCDIVVKIVLMFFIKRINDVNTDMSGQMDGQLC